MRVITGTARGARIKTLEGEQTRPTSGRVKEAIFSIIQFDIEGRRVLDLFAGTGQMGIETLSRGAESCTFVDNSSEAVKLIRHNLEHTKTAEGARVIQSDYKAFIKNTDRNTFHLVFIDPPYDRGLAEKALKAISQFDILTDNGIIIVETAGGETVPEHFEGISLKKTYRYGQTAVRVYLKDSGQAF